MRPSSTSCWVHQKWFDLTDRYELCISHVLLLQFISITLKVETNHCRTSEVIWVAEGQKPSKLLDQQKSTYVMYDKSIATRPASKKQCYSSRRLTVNDARKDRLWSESSTRAYGHLTLWRSWESAEVPLRRKNRGWLGQVTWLSDQGLAKASPKLSTWLVWSIFFSWHLVGTICWRLRERFSDRIRLEDEYLGFLASEESPIAARG